MVNRSQFAERARSILHSIVETYIESGEPVASRTIAKAGGHLSPATVRNVMADLYDEGYLAQPHTSAGRIPTVKAFRSYVQTLTTRRPSLGEVQRMRSELRRAESMEGRLEMSSHLLTEMTHNVGIAASIPTKSQTLAQIELLLLADRRVLMVVETRDHRVSNRVVGLDQSVTQDELNAVRNYFNENFKGWTLSRIQVELRDRLAQERAMYDAMLQRLEMLYQKGLLEVGLTPEVHLDGTSNLFLIDLALDKEKLRDLFRTLEEKQRLLALLERFLEAQPGAVGVQVGLGDVHPSMEELSLIGLTVTLPTGLATKFAVLGPLRMNYSQVMAAVFQVGATVESLSE
ncbi:MAG: heat-inducible transcriptional repressor HrcA [Acidobacteria bacterium]|jgi:heat-inducible transcriptional repressor|nr:heat-inducible transcriptional repressor HrcA [Acidobacteriota bacterium]